MAYGYKKGMENFMEQNLSKSRRILFLISVMMSNIAVMGDLVLYPITNNLYEQFAESGALVNYVLSGPPLLLLLMSLITPALLKKTTKRKLLITGGFLFAIGSACGVVIENIMWMACMRSLVGIGQGLINVCAVALICEVFVEENFRSRYIGYFNASMNVVGMIFTFFAGLLATSKWQNVFLLYLTAIPMLIMIILFVPEIKEENADEQGQSSESEGREKKKLGIDFWEMILTFFLLDTLCMVSSYFMSVYVAENNLGNAALTGTAQSLGQVVSFLAALVFGKIFMKLKRGTSLLGFALGILAFGGWYLLSGQAVVYTTYILQSTAYLFVFTYCYAQAPAFVPESRTDMAIGIITATYGIASFISTYVASFAMKLMHTDRFTDTLGIWAAVAVITFAGDLIYSVVRRKTVHV